MPSGGFAHKPPAWPSLDPKQLKEIKTNVDRLRDEYLRLSHKYGPSHPLTKAAREGYEEARGRPIEGDRR